MNRRSFFKGLSVILAGATTGLALINSPQPTKLKAKWTIEAAKDLEAMHGVTGDALLATGFVYAPYIPLYCTPQLVGNTEFAERFDKHLRSVTIKA